MVSHGRHFNADLVISLMDLWVVPPDLGQHIPYAPWFPIDHEPLQPGIARALPTTLMPLVFSHFGERNLRASGRGDEDSPDTLFVLTEIWSQAHLNRIALAIHQNLRHVFAANRNHGLILCLFE
jgi:hypothetical protein